MPELIRTLIPAALVSPAFWEEARFADGPAGLIAIGLETTTVWRGSWYAIGPGR
jgi:hypothetical protein